MSVLCETLFYPFETGRFSWPEGGRAVLFLNAQACGALDKIPQIVLQQYFKPHAAALQAEGHVVLSEIPEGKNLYDDIFVLVPKNADEARGQLAQAVGLLKENGQIFITAANDANGGRLKKWLSEAGFSDVEDASKNKARCAFGIKRQDIKEEILQDWLRQGEMQEVIDGGFYSRPGLFAWDKIDKGSALLASELPESLKGNIADFGCGYGFLSDYALKNCPGIHSLSCIDANFRALAACRKNLKKYKTSMRYFWEDLTVSQPGLQGFDAILMNPPFHDGKQADFEIGRAFIRTAHNSLRSGGVLWMVANAGLPYETELQALFSLAEKKIEKEGFKVFHAVK